MRGLILAAAGQGRRFAGAQPKQLLAIGGLPLWIHSLRRFHHLFDHAVVVGDAGLLDTMRAQARAHLPGWPLVFRAGGAERQDSVLAGLQALPAAVEAVLVHDAARPLITGAAIEACWQALRRWPACVLVSPCQATLKRCHGGADHLVRATENRDHFVLAETPQGFRRACGLAAFERARAAGWRCTDDVAVLERAGHPVHLLRHNEANPKLTVPADRLLIEAVLQAEAVPTCLPW